MFIRCASSLVLTSEIHAGISVPAQGHPRPRGGQHPIRHHRVRARKQASLVPGEGVPYRREGTHPRASWVHIPSTLADSCTLRWVQVPYIVYGGPKLQPGDSPSPDLPQLGESLVILEFLADAFPSAKLLPSDPFLRAKARLFYRAVEDKFRPAFVGIIFKQAPKEDLYAAVEHMQGLLPPTSGFAVGEWSIADAAFLPDYLRTIAFLEIDNAFSQIAPGLAKEVLATLRESPRFARIRAYVAESLARPSGAKTWDPVSLPLVGAGAVMGWPGDRVLVY